MNGNTTIYRCDTTSRCHTCFLDFAQIFSFMANEWVLWL